MPDMMVKNCYKCEKNFNSFRRRHHCRYCGLLFCANCSKLGVFLSNGVKLDRTCDKCLVVLQEPETKPSRQLVKYPYFPKDNSIYVDDEGDDVATESYIEGNIDLQGLFNEESNSLSDSVQQVEYLISEELESYLNSRCQAVAEKLQAEQWVEPLMQTVKELARKLKSSRTDKMDLSKYLRIVKLPVENKLKFFRGIVVKKNLAHKKMPSNFQKPKILILSGSVGYYLGEKNIISIMKLIKQEENFSKIILDLIKNIVKPDLIVIEKTMPYTLIEELVNMGVGVIQNVKKKTLKLISHLTESKILSSINQSLYQNGEYLGNCLEFWQQKIGNHFYCFFQSPDESVKCGTVLYNPQELQNVEFKPIMKKLITQFKSAILEKSVLDMFEVTKFDFEDFHSTQSAFIHVSTAKGMMCSRPRVHKIEYYSKEGRTLGDYIKFILSNVLGKCENNCEKRLIDHRDYYFKSKSAVCISCTVSDEPCKNLSAYWECKICGLKSQMQKMNELAWKFSFNKFIDNFFNPSPVETQTCEHRFYADGRFYLGFSSYFVMISAEPYTQYKVFRPTEYNPAIIESLMHQLMEQIKASGTNLYQEFLPIKEYLFQNSLSAFTAQNKPEDGVILNEIIRSIEDSFNSTSSMLEEIKQIVPGNYLEAELLRRSLFLSISKLIVELDAGLELLDSLEKRRSDDAESLPELDPLIATINSLHIKTSQYTDRVNALPNPDFQFFKDSSVTFQLNSSTYPIPINEEDSLSVISYALNSPEYQELLIEELDDSEDFLDKVEAELLGAKEEHFKYKFKNYKQEDFNNTQTAENFRKIYGDSISIKVVAYFYKQFHGVRSFCVGSHYDYILSISRSQKEALHLGKSKAFFKNSIDERFIIKIIGERQFRMFTDFAPNYFRHVCKNRFHNMPSCLVKILGAYCVKIKNKSTGKVRQEWVLINENLAYGLPKKSLVYDLKGTVNKRRKVNDGDEKTKMDLNFVEFMKGLPVVLGFEDKKRLDAEIWNDTLFLSQQNVVDYSLLLIIDIEERVINYGIIDYMEQYTFERAIESKYKSVVGTELPTIVYPKEYKNRFRQHLIQIYFMSVD